MAPNVVASSICNQEVRLTRTKPSLVCKPKIPRAKEAEAHLDSRTDFADPSTSHKSKQDQHPAVPQDHLDLELSGSSMRFLRGDGSDISLDHLLENISDDSSSSSSDATSVSMDDHARFAAAQSQCANILFFGRKGLPIDVFVRASTSETTVGQSPTVVDKSVLLGPNSSAPNATTATGTVLQG